MHLQIRLIPAASPPDVDNLLGRLAEGGVNLRAIGGSNVEFGGELAIVPDDADIEDAKAVLDRHKYDYNVLDVDSDDRLVLCEVKNEPGALHACLKRVAQDNLVAGRIIRDILIGIPDADEASRGIVPVHVYSEPVRTPAALEGGSLA